MEMGIRAAKGGCAGAEATIRSSEQGTAAKFSGLPSGKPSEQCRPEQAGLRNQLSDYGASRNMGFSWWRANAEMIQREATFTDSYCDRRSPKPQNGTALLTIFYAGTVAVYDVPKGKAEAIMALASSRNNIQNPQLKGDSANFGHQLASGSTPAGSAWASPVASTFPTSYNQRPNILSDQLAPSRKLSLQRFLEKRKERVISKSACNYAAPLRRNPPQAGCSCGEK